MYFCVQNSEPRRTIYRIKYKNQVVNLGNLVTADNVENFHRIGLINLNLMKYYFGDKNNSVVGKKIVRRVKRDKKRDRKVLVC